MHMGIDPNKPMATSAGGKTEPPEKPPLELNLEDTQFLTEVAITCGPINEASINILTLVGRCVTKERERLAQLSDQRQKSHQAELASMKKACDDRLTLAEVEHKNDVTILCNRLGYSHTSIFGIGCKFTPMQKRKLQRAGLTRFYDFTQKTWDEISKLVGKDKTHYIYMHLSPRGFLFRTN